MPEEEVGIPEEEVVERPTGEARVDAILLHLKEKHGFHLPAELMPEEEEEESEDQDEPEVDENGDPIEPETSEPATE